MKVNVQDRETFARLRTGDLSDADCYTSFIPIYNAYTRVIVTGKQFVSGRPKTPTRQLQHAGPQGAGSGFRREGVRVSSGLPGRYYRRQSSGVPVARRPPA